MEGWEEGEIEESLTGYCLVKSRWLVMAFFDGKVEKIIRFICVAVPGRN